MDTSSPLDQALDIATDWANDVYIQARVNMASSVASGNLQRTFDKVIRERRDNIEVAFTFPRYGVFLEKGAGRGRGGTKGTTWYDKNRVRKHTNPQSFGKMNTGKRLAAPWLNPAIDDLLPELEQQLADGYAGFIVAHTARIK